MNFLLDTNALIHLQSGKLAVPLPEGAYGISVITEIELLSWPQLQSDAELVWRGLLAKFRRVDLEAPSPPPPPSASTAVARCHHRCQCLGLSRDPADQRPATADDP